MQTLIVGLFCLFCWKIGWTKAPANENFFKMLFTSYQDQDGSNSNDAEDSGDGADEEMDGSQNGSIASPSKNKERPIEVEIN